MVKMLEARATRGIPTEGCQKAMRSVRLVLDNPTVRDLAVLVAFFTGVHGLLLLDYAARWDGWILYHRLQDGDWSGLFAWGRELGIPPFAYLAYLLGHLPHFVFWFKFTTFVSLLTATLVTYHLLGDFSVFGRADRLLLCMLIATFPANLVNVELIMTPYAVWYACFFVAAAVYRRSIRSHGQARLLTRLAALGLFYLSFMMQSLLVFYSAFLLYALLTWPESFERPRTRLWLFAQRHGDFIALPLLFWGLRTVWFRPFGHYEGYNAFHLDVPTLIGGWVPALYGALLVPLARSAHAIGQLPVVGLVMLAVLLLLRPMWASTQQWAPGALVGVGCGLVCIGLLPYLVVGKYPTLQDPSIWSSRFDYLVPIGAGFLVYGGLRWYLSFLSASRHLTMAAASVVIAGFAVANISNYLTFGIDALKQDAMVLRFRNQNEIAAAATVLVEDSATSLSADRGFTFYEYNGMLKQAFGDERRLGIEDRLYQDRAYMNRLSPFYGQPFYLLSEYDGRGPVVRVRVRSDVANWNTGKLYKLYLGTVYLRLLGSTEQRDSLVRRLLSIQVLHPEASLSGHSSTPAADTACVRRLSTYVDSAKGRCLGPLTGPLP